MTDLYDRQGNLQQVPDEQASAAIASGQFAPAPSATAHVADQSGQVFDVDSKDLHAALSNGMQLATGEQLHRADQEKEYGGGFGALQAAGFGAGSQLGLGFADEALIRSKAALHGVDPEQIREEVRNLKEVHPWAFRGGQALGVIAPALLSGGGTAAAAEGVEGGGLLARGALGLGKAITAPGRALGALGETGAEAVGGLVGEGAGTFAGRLAQKILPLAAQGGIEGSVLGAGEQFSEAALGEDHELSAEKILAGAGRGGLFGLAAGAGIGAVAGLGSEAKRAIVGRWRSSDVESLAARAFGHAPEGLGDAYAKAAAAASGGDEEAIRTLSAKPFTKEGAEVRRIATTGDEIRAQAARDMREHVDQIQSATRNLTEEAQGRLKLEQVTKSVSKGNEGAVAEDVLSSLDDVRSRVKNMLADQSVYGQRGSLKTAEQIIDGAQNRVVAAFDSGQDVNAKAFVELDYVKRRLGKFAKPGQFVSADQETAKEMRGIYDGLKGKLEDEGLWGKAAIQQREINKAWSDYLSTNQLFENKLTTEVGRDVNNPWLKARAADPGKLQTYVDNLTNPNNDLTHQLVKSQIEKSKALAQAISTQYELPASKAAELAKIQKAASAFQKTVDKAENSLVLGNQLKHLLASESSSTLGNNAATIGALIGGAPGAAVGSAVSALSRPGSNVMRLAALERMASRATERLGEGIHSFIHEASEVAHPVSQHFGHETLQSMFAAESDEVRKVAGSPAVAMENVNKSLAPIHEGAPNVAVQMAYKAVNAAKYLNDKLPQGTSAGGLFAGLETVRYSDADMAKWLRTKRVLDDPLSIIDEMKVGHVSPDDMDVVKSNYPKLFEQMKNTAIQEVMKAKKPISYQRKMALGVLFGVPVDETMGSDYLHMIAQGYASGAGTPGGKGIPAPSGRPMKVIQQSMTATQAIEGAAQ